MTRGLAATAGLWPDIRTAYGWVHRAAHLLANESHSDGATVRHRYQAHLAEMAERRDLAGSLAPAIVHFLKVSESYAPGLFHCYDVPGLPRTNNDLEQYFGAARRQERRTTGRKVASPGLVVRGSIRVIAAVATRLQPITAAELCPADLSRWQQLRYDLEARQTTRRAQLRFRRDPAAYLARLEAQLLLLTLPP